MIRRNFRLTAKRIQYLLKKGKKVGNEYVTLKFIPVPSNITTSRFCVVVSLKIDPRAVKRNRLKRQLYEIIRLHKDLVKKNSDIVVITKPPILKLDFATLNDMLTRLFKNLQ